MTSPLISILMIVASSAFADPTAKTGIIRSYNDETRAENVKIFAPASLEEIQEIVVKANERGEKLRVAGESHSINSIILSSGSYIKTNMLNRIGGIEVDSQGQASVSVQAGVQLGSLSRYLAERGYSLGFAFPAYHRLSLAGLLATGSHGTSRKHTAVSSQTIQQLTLVNGVGKVVTVDSRDPELFKAAKVNLGMLGVVYQVKLRIVPQFNLEFNSTVLSGETALLGSKMGRVNWGPTSDSEAIAWFPYNDRAIKFSGTISEKEPHPSAENTILGSSTKIGFTDYVAKAILMSGKHIAFIDQIAENLRYKGFTKNPPYVYQLKGKDIHSSSVVGLSGPMVMSRDIGLSPIFTQQDLSFSFPDSQAYEVLSTIREFSQKNNYRFPLLGIYFRFARSAGDSYMSHIERPGRGDEVYVMGEFAEIKNYGPNGRDDSSRSAKLRTELLSLLMQKHNVGFHWGKSVDSVFQESNIEKIFGDNLLQFRKQVERMDPNATFSTPYMEGLLFKTAAKARKLCRDIFIF